jgi:hypothetical protein
VDGQLVKWKQYALEEIKARNGKALKKLPLVYKDTSFDQFIKYL